ncbi:MAG: amidohydrolase family protein [Oscillospiraceae bacterium]|nr:amidohydrolase family protein [Oscillospiraceae bacterium]
MYIYNARIDPVTSPVIPDGFIRIENGVIAEISEGTPPHISPDDIDAEKHTVMPGLIDSHSHIGFIGDGGSVEAEDVNEASDPVTPQLRAIDGLNFMDNCFADAVKCGVTSAVTGVGSTNPIGGSLIAIKTAGRCADEMLIRPAAIKFALGENPKGCYSDRDETPMTRMATAALIREALFTARRYESDLRAAAEDDADMPDFDMKSEALIPLLRREVKAHFHCHRADDIMTAVRISEEFGLDLVLVHCTEGHLISDLLAEKHLCANIGPIICDRGKPELAHATLENAALLHESGVMISICTDHPEVPVDYLPASAAFCVKAGLPRDEAVRAITINAARITGIDDLTGSLEVGKDADIIMPSGDILDIMSENLLTMINGRIVYSQR